MKQLSLFIFGAILLATNATAQNEQKPAVSLIAGADMVIIAQSVGINGTLLLPISRVVSVAGNISYDYFFKNENTGNNTNMKQSNIAAGLRLGVPNDVFTQVTIGYASVSSPNFNYYDPTIDPKQKFGGTSFALDGGIQLQNNIELSGELMYATYKEAVGDYLFLKVKIAYAFRLKKQKQ
ncbi:hypothetical protein [Limnovirga soli]|uniref:Outer membrane protein beta-barrel domain-containing protein n=1 Tax=Limnovirga soli TaxID=2656915 RepID=A0A8J8FFE1_9BACT|nr:hypothetical protein [Limnovirga soli]NNV55364.1 hypothetical protein [Limnovirga soli]